MKVHRCCGLVRTVWKGNGLQTSISNSFKLNKLKTFLPRHIRLKHSGTSMASLQVKMKTKVEPQLFKYFLVLDFEATCEDRKEIVPQEIIEFPVLMLNSTTLEVESIFHQYVLPTVHSELTAFCTELTGILQEMVDGKKHLDEVLQDFKEWMKENKLDEEENSFIFVTCGDWDLKKMLPSQCQYFNIPHDEYFKKWINIKKAFSKNTAVYPKGMMPMLRYLNLPHIGRHHSGIDDCTNIANIVKELIKRGHIFTATGQL